MEDRFSKINSNSSYNTQVAEKDGVIVAMIGMMLGFHYETNENYVRIVALVVDSNDGVFVDSIIQGEIKESLRKTEEQKNEIDKIVLHLKFRYDRKQKEFDRLEKEKKRLLENSGA